MVRADFEAPLLIAWYLCLLFKCLKRKQQLLETNHKTELRSKTFLAVTH